MAAIARPGIRRGCTVVRRHPRPRHDGRRRSGAWHPGGKYPARIAPDLLLRSGVHGELGCLPCRTAHRGIRSTCLGTTRRHTGGVPPAGAAVRRTGEEALRGAGWLARDDAGGVSAAVCDAGRIAHARWVCRDAGAGNGADAAHGHDRPALAWRYRDRQVVGARRPADWSGVLDRSIDRLLWSGLRPLDVAPGDQAHPRQRKRGSRLLAWYRAQRGWMPDWHTDGHGTGNRVWSAKPLHQHLRVTDERCAAHGAHPPVTLCGRSSAPSCGSLLLSGRYAIQCRSECAVGPTLGGGMVRGARGPSRRGYRHCGAEPCAVAVDQQEPETAIRMGPWQRFDAVCMVERRISTLIAVDRLGVLLAQLGHGIAHCASVLGSQCALRAPTQHRIEPPVGMPMGRRGYTVTSPRAWSATRQLAIEAARKWGIVARGRSAPGVRGAICRRGWHRRDAVALCEHAHVSRGACRDARIPRAAPHPVCVDKPLDWQRGHVSGGRARLMCRLL